MKQKLDSAILLEYFPRWEQAKTKQEAGEIRKQLESLTGLSKATLFRMFERWKQGLNVLEIAERKNIKKQDPIKQAELEKRKQIAMEIAAIQRAAQKGSKRRTISRSEALRIALEIGVVNPEDLRHVTTVGRWMSSFGLSMRQYEQNQKQNRAAIHIDYKHVNNVFSVDATVLDRYFLDFNHMKLHPRPSTLPKGDNHEEDYMRMNGLSKIWVYYLVDCFSGVFWVKAYIPTKSETAKHGGENAVDMLDFLKECFLAKDNLVFSEDVLQIWGKEAEHLKQHVLQGVPNHLLCDKGSPCNKTLKPFLTRLGIQIDTHESGNPRAKKIESIISASKKVVESALNLLTNKQIPSLEVLNYILQAKVYHHCLTKGYFNKYLESALKFTIRRVNEFNLRDALVEHRPRVVNQYGEIRVAWNKHDGSKVYVVGSKLERPAVGTKVHVYRDLEGNVCAQDIESLKIYKCEISENVNNVVYGEFRGHKDNEEDKLRKVVDIRSKEIKRAIDITHVVPKPSPIIPFKPKTETIETSSIVPPDFFSSVDEAKTFIFMNTGVGFHEMDVKLKDAIEKSLENIFGALGKIDSNFVLLCINKIQESKNGNVYQHASN